MDSFIEDLLISVKILPEQRPICQQKALKCQPYNHRGGTDPEFYNRPINVKVNGTLVPDTELLEYVCNENERDRSKLIGTATEMRKQYTPVKVAPTVLAQYVGTYDFRFPENPTVPSLWPVTVNEGTLFIGPVPLVPLSDTRFLLGTNPLEFFKDSQGRVTHFSTVFVEGDLIGRKLPEKK